MSTTGPRSEHDDGEELGDDDARVQTDKEYEKYGEACLVSTVLNKSSEISIYTFIRHEDRLQSEQTDKQTDRQTNTTTDTKTSQQCTQYKRKKNHIILVLKCSYKTHVNSLKFMPLYLACAQTLTSN